MNAKKNDNFFNWMKMINGWQKSVFIAICISIILGSATFAYNNIAIPKDSKRIDVIQSDIIEIKSELSSGNIEKAVIKNDVASMKKSIDELKELFKDGFNQLNDKMNENNRIVKSVDKNTK